MNKAKSNKVISPKENKKTRKQENNNTLFILTSIVSIVFLGLLIYSNCFNCSFQFDDKHNIIENEAIKSLSNIKAMWEINHSRFIAFYSFALNYKIGQLNVWGYHFVNVIIHLINACLIFWMTQLLFLSPGLKNNTLTRHASSIALLTALFFVSHPLATGAVTYIVQRMASMVALFYFLSVALFMKARLTNEKRKYWLFACSFLAALFAIHSKENAYTLPLAILLIEMFFFNENKITIKFNYKILLLVLGFLGMIVFVLFNFSFSIFKPLPPTTFNTFTITPTNYFFTQLSVIVKYIQLLFIPIHQNIDYDFPLSNSLFEIPTMINGILLLSLLVLSIYLYNRNRIFSFGILWFFLTISIESSFIPISDIVFEHRTYLPSFGFFIILASGIYHFLWYKYKNMAILLFVLIIGSNAVLAHQRNNVWKDEFTLWSDAILNSPHKARPYINRGYAYGNKQQWDNAILDFTKANEINPKYHAAAYYNLGIAYWAIGQKQKSMENYSLAIEVDSKYADAYYGRGVCYYYLNDYDNALADYSKAISLLPRPELYYNRGMLYANKKMYTEAISDYSKAIETTPNNSNLFYSRALVYGNTNQWEKAADDFTKTIQLDPQNKSAYSNREFAFSKIKASSKK